MPVSSRTSFSVKKVDGTSGTLEGAVEVGGVSVSTMVGPMVGRTKKAPREALVSYLTGGEGGIRTHGALSYTPDFESGTFDHSATSPVSKRGS